MGHLTVASSIIKKQVRQQKKSEERVLYFSVDQSGDLLQDKLNTLLVIFTPEILNCQFNYSAMLNKCNSARLVKHTSFLCIISKDLFHINIFYWILVLSPECKVIVAWVSKCVT